MHDPPGVMALERVPSSELLERAARWTEAGIAVRSHDRIARFASSSPRTPIGRLQIGSLPGGQTLNVGPADSLVKPVWSADGRFLMYVTFSPSHTFPGVQWTLMQYDGQNHRSTRLARLPGVAMVPLGWWRTRPLFLMATGSDSSIYEVRSGRASFLDVLAPQTVTSAALSPTAHVIAFAAPTNCYNCTLDIFDLRTHTEWSGPSGGTNEAQLAWSRDGRSVVTEINGRLATVLASPNSRERLGGSVTLPNVWQHSVTASISRSGVRLLDQITGQSVFSPFRAGKV